MRFDGAPDTISASLTPAGHELLVTWSADQIEGRVSISDGR